MIQQIVETKKVATPRKNLNSLTRLWFQTLTQYQKKLTRIKLLMIHIGHIVDMVRLDMEFVEDSIKTRIFKGWADCSVYGFWKVPIPCVHKSPQDI